MADADTAKNGTENCRQIMIEELTQTEVEAMDSGECPDCGNTGFLEGPHGGMCVNIMCASCGARFNILPGMKGFFGKQRIGRHDFHLVPEGCLLILR